jgi:hypothetical protein
MVIVFSSWSLSMDNSKLPGLNSCRDPLGALAQAEILVHDVALKRSMSVGLCNLGFIGTITFCPSMMLLLLFRYVSVTTGANHLALLTKLPGCGWHRLTDAYKALGNNSQTQIAYVVQ